jgi:hypothetical protein
VKYRVTDVIRRAFENALANWPMMLLRFASGILMMVVCFGAVVALLVPVAIWFGLSLANTDAWRNLDPEQIVPTLVAHGAFIILGLLFLCAVVMVLACIYAFVEAAVSRIYYDGEMAATAREATGDRSSARFNAFTIARFFEAGRTFWWRTFMVYNTIWGACLAIVLIPLLVTLAVIYTLKGSPVAIGIGCLMLLLSLMLLVVLAVGASAWCTKSVMVVVSTGARAGDAIRTAWREFRVDVGRHLAVVVLLVVVSMALSSALSSISLFSNIAHRSDAFGPLGPLTLMFAPARILAQLLSSVVGAVVGAVYTAAFATLQADRRV